MQCHYSWRDYNHYFGMYRRNKRRQKIWARLFEKAIRDKSFRIPSAAVVQIIPTDYCNLRCPMCNQWGETGYFFEGIRTAQHMGGENLVKLIRSLSARESLISIHGGEPFVYKQIEKLLDLLSEQPFDVIISTNGTLLSRYLEQVNKIKNLGLLLSIDGDLETHDKIRGHGRFKQINDGLVALFELRRRTGGPLPLVILNFVVCEWNTNEIEKVYDVARQWGVFALNYNMRWFLTEEIGIAYEAHLEKYFNLKSSGAWRGWISNYKNHDYKLATTVLQRMTRKKRFNLIPPYVTSSPGRLRGNEFDAWFSDYLNVFGCDSCFMPFYWARILSNGDLIYCPGHPDIIGGNVFRDGFMNAFNSEITIKFRKHILSHRFPICNRCCGLYMTKSGRPYERKVRRKMGLNKPISGYLN